MTMFFLEEKKNPNSKCLAVSRGGSVADICHEARTDCDILAFVVYTDTQKHLQHM